MKCLSTVRGVHKQLVLHGLHVNIGSAVAGVAVTDDVCFFFLFFIFHFIN